MIKQVRYAHVLALLAALLILPSLYYYHHHRRIPSLTTHDSYLRHFPSNPNFTDTPKEFLSDVLTTAKKSRVNAARLQIETGFTNEQFLIPRGYRYLEDSIRHFCPPMNGVKSACMTTLSNVYVDDLGTAIQPSTRAVYELSGGCCHWDWQLYINTTQTLPQPTKGFPGKVVLILNGHHSTTYHHVFHDVLPLYLMFARFLEQNPEVLIGLSRGTLGTELLQLLGVPSKRIVFMNDWAFVSVALFPPSVFGQESDLFNEDIERGCARVVAEAVPMGLVERVSLQRSNGTLVLLERARKRYANGACREQRCATNLSELKKRLEHAFKGVLDIVIYPASASIKSAVRVFRHARMVVGVHGGGFQNIMFCEKGTVVVHIGWDRHYADVADRFNLKYYLSKMPELKRESRGVVLDVDRVMRDSVEAARKVGILSS